MVKFKPVYLSYDPKVSPAYAAAAAAAIREILEIAGVADRIPFADMGSEGHWVSPAGIDIPCMSMEILLRACASSVRSDAVSGKTISIELLKRKWQDLEPHYDVVLTKAEMLSNPSSPNGIQSYIGTSTRGFSAVLSLSHFKRFSKDQRIELMKTALLHELGRMFGLCPKLKKHGIIYCTQICVMRAIQSPIDLECYTDDRLESQPFCLKCFEKLCAFFT